MKESSGSNNIYPIENARRIRDSSTKELSEESLMLIGPLPSERLRTRYSNLEMTGDENAIESKGLSPILRLELLGLVAPQKEENRTNENLTLNELDNLLHDLANRTANNKEIIERIASWVGDTDDGKIQQERSDIVEKQCAIIIRKQAVLTLGIVGLLGAIAQESSGRFLTDELSSALEQSDIDPTNLFDQLAALNRIETPEVRLELHKILDFFQSHIERCQNATPDDEHLFEPQGYRSGLIMRFIQFTEGELENSKNYLLKQHWVDVYESVTEYDNENREGTVTGTAGGSSNRTIYTFQHLIESYDLRLKYGIREGYAIANLVIPIAPGYLGFYDGNGSLKKIFPTTQLIPGEASTTREAYREHNDPHYETVYDDINEASDLSLREARYSHSSNKQEAFRPIWDLDKRLIEDGKTFFYDLNRLDIPELHPLVLGDILSRNLEYIKKMEGAQNQSAELATATYESKLFPHKEPTEEELYRYRYLSKIGTRKTLEDTLGVDLATMPMYVQAQLITVLGELSASEYERLEHILHNKAPIYRRNFLSSFLACAINPKEKNTLQRLAEKLPTEISNLLFSKYYEIITAIGNIEEYLTRSFVQQEGFSPKEIQAIVVGLLARGNRILESADKSTSAAEQILSALERTRVDLLLFSSAFKTASETRPLTFEDIKDTELFTADATEISSEDHSEDRADMLRIYEENRPGYSPELLKVTMSEFESALATSGKKFYILKNNGAIVAFIRFDELKNGNLYAGSLNVRPEARGSAIGSAMLIDTLSKEGAARDIEAVSYSKNPMLKHYIEDFGFAVVREIPDYHGTGELFYELKRPAGWKKETIAKKAA